MELNDRHRAQERYALWLQWGTRAGLLLLVVAFVAYLAGATPHVPIEQLPKLWEQPASHLLAQTGSRPGWHWATLLARSDMMVLLAIAFLATCSILCVAAVVPIFRRRGEKAFVAICVLQVAVIVLAASGILAIAH